MHITDHRNMYSLVLAMVCTWCANIYIRKLRRKTHLKNCFFHRYTLVDNWIMISNFQEIFFFENAHRALLHPLSFFLIPTLSLAFSPPLLSPYRIVFFVIEISLLTDVSSWRLYGSVRKVENGAITSFKVSLKERRVRNFETRVTDIGSIQSFSVDTRSSYVVLYKSCCVNAEEERKKERKKKWRRGEEEKENIHFIEIQEKKKE